MQQKLNVILGYKMGWMLYEMIIQYWGGEGNGKGGKGTPHGLAFQGGRDRVAMAGGITGKEGADRKMSRRSGNLVQSGK